MYAGDRATPRFPPPAIIPQGQFLSDAGYEPSTPPNNPVTISTILPVSNCEIAAQIASEITLNMFISFLLVRDDAASSLPHRMS